MQVGAQATEMGAKLSYGMLALDLPTEPSMCVPVKDIQSQRGRIAALLVEAGCVMEDESVALVSVLPAEAAFVEARIARLVQVAADLTALANAASAILRNPT